MGASWPGVTISPESTRGSSLGPKLPSRSVRYHRPLVAALPAVALPSLFLIITASSNQVLELQQEGPNSLEKSQRLPVTGTSKAWGEHLSAGNHETGYDEVYNMGNPSTRKEMNATFGPHPKGKGCWYCTSDATSLLEVSCSPRQQTGQQGVG